MPNRFQKLAVLSLTLHKERHRISFMSFVIGSPEHGLFYQNRLQPQPSVVFISPNNLRGNNLPDSIGTVEGSQGTIG